MQHSSLLIFGFCAALLTTVCNVPQLLKILKSHHTKDISFPTYTILAIGIFFWFLYGLFIKDSAIIVSNFFTFIIVAWIWILKVKYG